MFDRLARRRSLRQRWPSALLASVLILLTLGVGTAEAWHGDEHAEEEPCAECVLCTVTLQGPITAAPTAVGAQHPGYERAQNARGLPALHVVAERRTDAPRAPPA